MFEASQLPHHVGLRCRRWTDYASILPKPIFQRFFDSSDRDRTNRKNKKDLRFLDSVGILLLNGISLVSSVKEAGLKLSCKCLKQRTTSVLSCYRSQCSRTHYTLIAFLNSFLGVSCGPSSRERTI